MTTILANTTRRATIVRLVSLALVLAALVVGSIAGLATNHGTQANAAPAQAAFTPIAGKAAIGDTGGISIEGSASLGDPGTTAR